MTDLHVPPESLLKFVRCKCKLSSKNPCNTSICSCRKNGLKCITACGNCHGEGCNNSEEIMLEIKEETGITLMQEALIFLIASCRQFVCSCQCTI